MEKVNISFRSAKGAYLFEIPTAPVLYFSEIFHGGCGIQMEQPEVFSPGRKLP